MFDSKYNTICIRICFFKYLYVPSLLVSWGYLHVKMDRLFVPSILRPAFTWPRPMRHAISETTPPVPHIPGKTIRRVWGIIHRALYQFSQWYCSWFDIPFDVNILQLPFGLVMKWTDRTSLEEAIAMQMVGAAGIPVPKVINCGEHPDAPFNRVFSILMTRLPGAPWKFK